MEISKIDIMNLRDIWPDEAHDFTPWLATEFGLSQLSAKIGMPLELIQIEQKVGGFNADILAKTKSGDFVVIENQYSKTDHDHLGKTLTYLIGSEAKTVIWIAEEARDEHIKVFEWLNDNTPEDISFFLLTIKAIKIDNSSPAPLFEIIVSPNQWAKVQKATVNERKETEIRGERNKFFEELKKYDISKNGVDAFKWRKFIGDHWTDLAIGSAYVHISITLVPKFNNIGIELYIYDNQKLYEYLEKFKLDIDLKIPDLQWMALEDKKASRIKKEIEGDFRYVDDKKQLFDEILNTTKLFFDVFRDKIKNFKEI